MRVLIAGTFEPGFARNVKLLRLLELEGHTVEVCRVDLWGDDRVGIPTKAKTTMFARALLAYPTLIWKFLRSPRADVVLVAYPGWFDMLLLAPLARLRRMPVVFDIFISLHDTIVTDRQLVRPTSTLARLLSLADRMALRLAGRVIADTPAHAAFFANSADVPSERVGVVWLGANDDVFVPQPQIEVVANRVLFHGTFIRLQGIETIVRAAKLLEPHDVTVRIVGSGQEQPTVDRLVAELEPSNLELVGLVPLQQVPKEIAAAELVLGVFGTSTKADNVVPNKLYECLAVGRPVLTGDTEAIRSAFEQGEVATSPCGDPEALAAAVLHLLDEDSERELIGRRGAHRYATDYHERALGPLLTAELAAVVVK